MHIAKRLPWLLLIVFYIPLILMILFSLNTGSGRRSIDLRTLDIFHMTLSNYKSLPIFGPVLRWFSNTIIYSAIVAIGSGFLSIAGAYAMLKMKKRIRSFSLGILVLALTIPTSVIIIPLFMEIHYLGISGITAVLLKALTAPSAIILAWQFMKGIPDGYIESAVIYGATDLQIIWNIIIPFCKPVFALIIITKGIEFNGDYLWQSVNLISKNAQTILVAFSNQFYSSLFVAFTGGANRINVQMAMGVCMFLPMALMFLAGRKQLMDYTIEGGIKG
jgi:ABC-type glycerol-3-phosphate transport system permease component